MDFDSLDQAVELLEKANADLEPELLGARDARRVLATYARAERLAAFGVATMTAKVDEPAEVADVTGTSMGRAKAVVATGKVLGESDDLREALRHGDVSLDQAAEIAAAEEAAPGAAAELVAVAQNESFQVLKEEARRVKLDAEQHRDLGARQLAARGARSHVDALGMVHIHLALQPHVGAPIVARAEAEGQRLSRKARRNGGAEPFGRHLADAYASLLAGSGKIPPRRPELVVLVSHEVATRGWRDVQPGEVCKIPGVGPVPPEVAGKIAEDAFLTGVFYDGVDLRHMKRWSRSIPIEIRIALELGDPPEFDGVRCVDCGNRFRTELDHVMPRSQGGTTSKANLDFRCWPCHQEKTKRERRSAVARSGET